METIVSHDDEPVDNLVRLLLYVFTCFYSLDDI
jgi:hypothetical protein